MPNTAAKKRIVSALCALLMLVVLPTAAPGSALVRGGAVGIDVSGFSSVTFEGEPVDGSIFRENTMTVINIWQRWCGPCWVEMPVFLQLYEHYSAHPEAGVSIWGALHFGDNPDTIQEAVDFVAEYGYCWNHMIMCSELAYAASGGSEDGTYAVPQTLIIDRDGIVRAQFVGKFETIEELLDFTEYWLGILSAENAQLPGDVDGSGEVTTSDALLALRFSMGVIGLEGDQLTRADVDKDGDVDSADALMILRAALGLAGSPQEH